MDNENMEINTKIENKYNELIQLMNSLKCMTICKEKIDMYLRVSKDFSELSGYKKSNKYSKICKQTADKIGEDVKKLIYDRAKKQYSSAQSVDDYYQAAKEFSKISGFLDADHMASECMQLSKKKENKIVKTKLIILGFVLMFFVSIILFFTTSIGKYTYANMCMKVKFYNNAITIYKNLGNYKDSKDRIILCNYLQGLQYEIDGEYVKAEEAFSASNNYKDSKVKKFEAEKMIISNSLIGDSVKVGNCKWVIIDKENNKALLLKKAEVPGWAYHNKNEDVVWEISSIRSYLNTEFLTKTFSDIELNHIILTTVKNDDNEIYGTAGGNDTMDYVFLLNINEVIKYQSLFPKYKNNSWLRTPGYNQRAVAFLSVNKSIMDYGYLASNEELSVIPALWFAIEEE